MNLVANRIHFVIHVCGKKGWFYIHVLLDELHVLLISIHAILER